MGRRNECVTSGGSGSCGRLNLITTVKGSIVGLWDSKVVQSMMLHDNFEWDEDKANRNLKKHGVRFDDAALVLADDDGSAFHVEEYDGVHSSGEDRYVTTASHPDDRRIVLIVAWTDRSTPEAKV